LKAFALIHQSGTPPHFFRDKIQISKSSVHQIDFSLIITKLMPFPYSTDCYDYKQEVNSRILYNSRDDCFLKHLEWREIEECGCNKRWSYWSRGLQNSSHICPKSLKCNFNSKLVMKLLERVCKKNCYNEYYMNTINHKQFDNYLEILENIYFHIIKSVKYEITFNYLPKMNLVEYFCSVGGLVSMWFGLSIYDIALIFVIYSKMKITLIFYSILENLEKNFLQFSSLKKWFHQKWVKYFR
jgi:hypothetical protein